MRMKRIVPGRFGEKSRLQPLRIAESEIQTVHALARASGVTPQRILRECFRRGLRERGMEFREEMSL
jgi:hypothetical protein